MALESSLSNIVIRNNTIDQGSFSDGSTPATYNYAYNAWIFGSSLIQGNTFSSPTTGTDILNIDECSCIIKDNKFLRGSTTINSYIRNYGSNDQIIVNNIFDQATIDGSSEVLVIGLTVSSNYYGNKNQTLYIPISLAYAGFRTFGGSGTTMDLTGGESNFAVQAIAHHIAIVNSRATIGIFESNFSINNFLPEGIRILEFKFGASRDNSGSPALNGAGSNQFSLNVKSIDTVASNYTSGLNSILDVTNTRNNTLNSTTTTTNLNSGTVFSDLASATQYYSIDVSSSDYYVNNKNYLIVLQFTCQFILTSGTATVRFSPVVVKCRW